MIVVDVATMLMNATAIGVCHLLEKISCFYKLEWKKVKLKEIKSVNDKYFGMRFDKQFDFKIQI